MKTLRYATDLYNAIELKYWAQWYLEVLPKGVRTLVVRGSSGISLASAMCTLSTRPLNFVALRKPGESAHSAAYAGTFPHERNAHLAIVDDFIQTGATIEAIKRGLVDYGKLHLLKYIIVSHVDSGYVSDPEIAEIIELEGGVHG